MPERKIVDITTGGRATCNVLLFYFSPPTTSAFVAIMGDDAGNASDSDYIPVVKTPYNAKSRKAPVKSNTPKSSKTKATPKRKRNTTATPTTKKARTPASSKKKQEQKAANIQPAPNNIPPRGFAPAAPVGPDNAYAYAFGQQEPALVQWPMQNQNQFAPPPMNQDGYFQQLGLGYDQQLGYNGGFNPPSGINNGASYYDVFQNGDGDGQFNGNNDNYGVRFSLSGQNLAEDSDEADDDDDDELEEDQYNAEESDENDDYLGYNGIEPKGPKAPKAPANNKDGTPRKKRSARAKLCKWTDADWKMAVIGIVYACGQDGVVIPFDKAAKIVSPYCTSSAIQQAILKLRQRMVDEGRECPKVSMNWSRGFGSARTPNARTPNARTPSSGAASVKQKKVKMVEQKSGSLIVKLRPVRFFPKEKEEPKLKREDVDEGMDHLTPVQTRNKSTINVAEAGVDGCQQPHRAPNVYNGPSSQPAGFGSSDFNALNASYDGHMSQEYDNTTYDDAGVSNNVQDTQECAFNAFGDGGQIDNDFAIGLTPQSFGIMNPQEFLARAYGNSGVTGNGYSNMDNSGNSNGVLPLSPNYISSVNGYGNGWHGMPQTSNVYHMNGNNMTNGATSIRRTNSATSSNGYNVGQQMGQNSFNDMTGLSAELRATWSQTDGASDIPQYDGSLDLDMVGIVPRDERPVGFEIFEDPDNSHVEQWRQFPLVAPHPSIWDNAENQPLDSSFYNVTWSEPREGWNHRLREASMQPYVLMLGRLLQTDQPRAIGIIEQIVTNMAAGVERERAVLWEEILLAAERVFSGEPTNSSQQGDSANANNEYEDEDRTAADDENFDGNNASSSSSAWETEPDGEGDDADGEGDDDDGENGSRSVSDDN
ncbi:hypothetical protein EJ04DRAFT_42053 [Polyplosphaeria fusca]|uniref:Uncharacterized protein n=1 Tax=Polyplosphaeria fusca TaxID=682080 RepID=A0A9P4R897_9PLEO|nr:hypothetical protein EJ04DRAFT_42053 [Polyplosphaeria fusca]